MKESGRQDESISTAQAVREGNGRVTQKQLWRLIKNGKLQAVQPGGRFARYRIRRGDLEQLLEPVPPQEKN